MNLTTWLFRGLAFVPLVSLGCGAQEASSAAEGGAAALPAEPRAAYEELFAGHGAENPTLELPTLRVFRDDRLQQATDLAIHGDRVAVLCRAAAGRLCLIDTRTGAIATPEPRPEVEWSLLDPISIEPGDGESPAFWAYDQMSRALLHVAPASEGFFEGVLHLESPIRQAAVFGGTVAANGPFAHEQLLYFAPMGDPDASSLRVSSAVGQALFRGKPPEVSIHLNRNSLAADPERGRLVLAYLYVSRLHLYGADSRQVLAVAGPEEVELAYDLVADQREGILRLLANDRTQLAYLDVAASRHAIYALYSGRDRQTYGAAAKYGDQIHVFSWEGRHLATAQTKEDLFRIAVGADGGPLYGIRYLPSEAVVEIGLEAIEPLVATEGDRRPEGRRKVAR